MQKLYSYQYPEIPNKDMPVKSFADMLAAGLVERDRRILPKGIQSFASKNSLKRVADQAGNSMKTLTKKQKIKGRHKGCWMQLTCIVCKRYKKEYSYTTAATCPHCGTAICMEIDRSKKHPDRIGTCFHEHLNTGISDLKCSNRQKKVFPPKHQLWS